MVENMYNRYSFKLEDRPLNSGYYAVYNSKTSKTTTKYYRLDQDFWVSVDNATILYTGEMYEKGYAYWRGC